MSQESNEREKTYPHFYDINKNLSGLEFPKVITVHSKFSSKNPYQN